MRPVRRPPRGPRCMWWMRQSLKSRSLNDALRCLRLRWGFRFFPFSDAAQMRLSASRVGESSGRRRSSSDQAVRRCFRGMWRSRTFPQMMHTSRSGCAGGTRYPSRLSCTANCSRRSAWKSETTVGASIPETYRCTARLAKQRRSVIDDSCGIYSLWERATRSRAPRAATRSKSPAVSTSGGLVAP